MAKTEQWLAACAEGEFEERYKKTLANLNLDGRNARVARNAFDRALAELWYRYVRTGDLGKEEGVKDAHRLLRKFIAETRSHFEKKEHWAEVKHKILNILRSHN